MISAVVLLVVMLAIRGASGNRYVRGRLLVSGAVVAVYVAGAAAIRYARLSPEISQQLDLILPLVLAFGVINAVVALTINPWRVDRIPERFPRIVQDTIAIVLFAIAATLILQEKIFATTAVGAVVIGFALQDTLGNLFAGLAIQIEKPFRVGQWVNLAGKDGIVTEITWRATKIRTKAGNYVVVPNSALARDTITNYSEPVLETRLEVMVGASYDVPPNRVKSVIRDAVRDDPALLPEREPEVLLADFGASAITYRVWVWTSDFGNDERLCDRIRSRVYYAFRRTGIEIPYPIQVEIPRTAVEESRNPTQAYDALRAVDIFAALSDDQRLEMANRSRLLDYAAGETIVREGDAGESMFVMCDGLAAVTLGTGQHEVARLGPGNFFGEISLLTGDPRTATVSAATDCRVIEVTAEDFRRLVLPDPAVVDRVAVAVAARRTELDRHRAEHATSLRESEPPATFVDRVRRFLRLT